MSALETLADVPDEVYCSAAASMGFSIFCWCRKKECSKIKAEPTTMNDYMNFILFQTYQCHS